MALSKKVIFAIIPLVAILFITTYNDDVFSEEIHLECPTDEVIVIRTTNPNPICIDEDTANKWVQYGMATIVEDVGPDEVEDVVDEP